MDDLAVLLLELGGLLTGLSLLGLLARRISLPTIPLVLLAGLAFGTGGVLPITQSLPFVEVAAEIGVVLLLLVLGLEFTSSELVSSLHRHTPSGLVDLLLNATPGLLAGLVLGLGWAGSLALAGITWISSSGIIARMLDDLGRLANRETPSILSVLVLEDIAMAVFLPVLGVALSGGGPGSALAGSALAAGGVVLVLLAAHHQGHRLGRLLAHPDDEQVLLRLFGLTLLVAGATQGLGASAAVGAFLVGIAVPPSLADRARRILGPLRDLFAAFFFAAFGLATDPATVWPVLPAALGLALLTGSTKVVTGWVAAGRDGVGFAGRLRAGTALIPRGEFSIVIAGLAVTAGHDRVGPLATGYVLVLAVVGPLLTRFSDRWSQRYGSPHGPRTAQAARRRPRLDPRDDRPA